MKLTIDSVNTDVGKDAEVQFFTGLISNSKISYFKLGEGGWAESNLVVEDFATGDGTTSYSGTLVNLPAAQNSVTITNGLQAIADNGDGTMSGDGTGTINYKTGAVSVVFDSIIYLGEEIEAKYKYRGSQSADREEIIASGDGTIGTYYGAVTILPMVPSSVSISDGGSQVLTDDGAGNLSGDGTGAVDYDSGQIEMEFDSVVTNGNDITATYKYDLAPKDPDATLTDLESESVSGLYTFQRSFTTSDIAFQGEDSGTIICTIHLEKYEGLDDGTGSPPVFFEGGIFSENDVMLHYFTFNALWNDGSTEINIYVSVVV